VSARYVAIIMDGNARWAQQRGLPVLAGHRAGAQALKRTVRNAVRHGVLELSVYAFSTENWSRPRREVEGLMSMFAEMLDSETPELRDEGVRMRFAGRRDRITAELLDRMEWAEEQTADRERMTLYVCFDYGGRDEILDAARRYDGGGEEAFVSLLQAPEMHDPDLLIRTSGERRLSNFLLWQSAYSELAFVDVLWPDFDDAQLAAVLEDYASRERRFGAR
jgi:undecaprenyl diphosphate synthase